MSEKKSKLVPLIILFIFVLLGVGMFVSMLNEREAELDSVTANTLEGVAENIEDTAEISDNNLENNTDVDITTLNNTGEAMNINLDAALEERVLGNPDAPIKISEYSSFSCGHCGNFHQNVFAEFKAKWIDTEKAYLVFSDFPLNAPALHASLVGRCITNNDQYFDYVEEVYAKQQNWAFQSDHITPLKAIAVNYGIDSQKFDSCIENEELQAGLLDKVRAAQQQFNVNSTPSFVVNNAVTIAGGADYPKFNAILEDAVAESNKSPDETLPVTPAEAE